MTAFGYMKNFGQRAERVETCIRSEMGRLLSTAVEQADASETGLRERFRYWWKHRGQRSRLRNRIGQLWLGVVQLKGLSWEWADRRARLLSNFESQNGFYSLFELDDTRESVHRESLNLSTIQSALEHSSSQLDVRLLALATVLGVVAGIVAGVLVA